MKKLSSKFFEGTRCYSFGDITYLPTSMPPLNFDYPAHGGWLKGIIPDYARGPEASPMILAASLQNAFDRHMVKKGKEPKWIGKVNKLHRANFRRSHAIQECDLLFALPQCPRAGIGYIIEDRGFTHKVCEAFGLWRLQNIAQLGKLHDPVITHKDTRSYARIFEHSRLAHSLDVRAIALCMALNNRLGKLETRTLEVAGLTHDTLTPAYGDGTKALDPEFFDEDLHFQDLFARKGWSSLRDSYGLDEELLVETVQGRGVLGTLLDVADKSSYLARDTDIYLRRYAPHGPGCHSFSGNSPKLSPAYEDVRKLISKRPNMFALWETVEVRGHQVVFGNSRWLEDFLRLRILMFKNLYYNSGSRYLERMMSTILVRHLLETGVISKQDLLLLTDQHLDAIIRENFGLNAAPILGSSHDMLPRVEVFENLGKAKERERELLQNGAPITFLDSHPVPKTATHYLVRRRGKTAPFKEIFPREAEELEEIAGSIPAIKLYYAGCSRESLPPVLQDISKALHAARLGANGAILSSSCSRNTVSSSRTVSDEGDHTALG